MDSNREMRAMILCLLPYPPLPVTGRRFEENKLGDSTVITSHDIISQLLEVACVKNQPGDNSRRKQRQEEVMEGLLSDLKGTTDPAALYAIYCRRTAEHIAAYFPSGNAPELRFMPLDYCCRGDAVHKRFTDYMKAQSFLMNAQGGQEQEWKEAEFPSLILAARDNWVADQGRRPDMLGETPPVPDMLGETLPVGQAPSDDSGETS